MSDGTRIAANLPAVALLALAACGSGGGSSPDGGPSVTVVVSPSSVSLVASGTQKFVATVSGSTNTAVTWSATGGVIDQTGLFTAPVQAGSYQVQATSQADASSSAVAKVSVGTIGVAVTPAAVAVLTSKSQQFSATVSGASDTAVAWTAARGSISSGGLYTAPASAGADEVTATSHADPSRAATVQVAVVQISVSVAPVAPTVSQGGTQQFTATVGGGWPDASVTWSATCGSIDGAGLFAAPMSAGTCTVTAASNADPSKSATASVTVPAVAVSVAPTSAAVPQGGQQQFAATVTGAANAGVSWSATCGQVTQAGLFTAPASAGSCQVAAMSIADPAQSAVATVTVPAVSVSVSPAQATVGAGGAQQFTAAVQGTVNTAVSWSATCGSVNASGLSALYTAPGSATTCQVTVTSVADATKSATAAVTVTTAPSVSVAISPASATVIAGGQQQFTASVTGSSNTAVTWSQTCGSVTQSGLYTAPASATTCQVTATSNADASKAATATVTVTSVNTHPTSRFKTAALAWDTFDNVSSSNTSVVQDQKPGAAGDLVVPFYKGGWSLYCSQDGGSTWAVVNGPASTSNGTHTGGIAQDSVNYDLHAVMNSGADGNIYYSRFTLVRDAGGHVSGWTWGADGILVGAAPPEPDRNDWTDVRFQVIEAVDGQGAKVLLVAYLYATGNAGTNLAARKTTATAGVTPGASGDFTGLDGASGETIVSSASGDANWSLHNQIIGVAQQPVDRSLHFFRGNAAEFFNSGPGIQRWRYAAGKGSTYALDSTATVAAQPAGGQGPCWGGVFQTQDSIWLVYYDDARGGIFIDRITSDGATSIYNRSAVPGPPVTRANGNGYLGYASISVNASQSEVWTAYIDSGNNYSDTWTAHWNGGAWNASLVSSVDMSGFGATAYWRGGLAIVERSASGASGEIQVISTPQ